MELNDKDMSREESLQLITTMINNAKGSYHDSGIGAIMWGSLIAFCALVKCAEIHYGFRLFPFDVFMLTIVAVIPQVIISMREARQRKVRSYNDAAMDYIWIGFGISIFLLSFITSTMQQGMGDLVAEYKKMSGGTAPGFRLYEYMTPLFLVLYGLPTFATGGIMKFKPMLWGGLFFWVCALTTVYTPGKVDLLLTALAAITGWLIPGIILKRRCRRAKRAAATAHV